MRSRARRCVAAALTVLACSVVMTSGVGGADLGNQDGRQWIQPKFQMLIQVHQIGQRLDIGYGTIHRIKDPKVFHVGNNADIADMIVGDRQILQSSHTCDRPEISDIVAALHVLVRDVEHYELIPASPGALLRCFSDSALIGRPQ